MNKIYSRTGDGGFTTLANGKKVKKYSELVVFYGYLDELNVFLGFAVEALYLNESLFDLLKKLLRIQKELFKLGLPANSKLNKVLNTQTITDLEREIDSLSQELPVLQNFILPSGGELSLRLHLARVVCRRAERIAFKLSETKKLNQIVAIYLNRLGDWLYIAARTAAWRLNIEELPVE